MPRRKSSVFICDDGDDYANNKAHLMLTVRLIIVAFYGYLQL